MWSKPWSYKEGLIIGAGLLVIGALLQITVGMPGRVTSKKVSIVCS